MSTRDDRNNAGIHGGYAVKDMRIFGMRPKKKVVRDNVQVGGNIWDKLAGKSPKVINKWKSAPEQYDTLLSLNDIPDILTYDNGHVVTANLHRGQRKLFLGELECLIRVYKTIEDPSNLLVVYAGAAPSHKTHYLALLFPDVKFLLVDPGEINMFMYANGVSHRKKPYDGIIHLKTKPGSQYNGRSATTSNIAKFIERSEDQIFIYEDLFTDAMCDNLAKTRMKIVFMSDIRTREGDDEVSNSDLIWNLSQQHGWICRMGKAVVISMLKFRCPFLDPENTNRTKFEPYMEESFEQSKRFGIDFVKDYADGVFRYFDGDVQLQCFAGVKSTETRLITNGQETREYDQIEFESKLYYFNCVMRSMVKHPHQYAGHPELPGCDMCNDCAKEMYLWEKYLEVRPLCNSTNNETIFQLVQGLNVVNLPLIGRDTTHGHFFGVNANYLWMTWNRRAKKYR